jgi:hypothetical protein
MDERAIWDVLPEDVKQALLNKYARLRRSPFYKY